MHEDADFARQRGFAFFIPLRLARASSPSSSTQCSP
jgi:hypothetical protein